MSIINSFTDFLISITMILVGLIFIIKPPKFNEFYGYRTTYSMKSKEAFEFANNHFSKLWLIFGTISFIFIIVLKGSLTLNSELTSIICMIISLFNMFIPLVLVDRELKINFTSSGKLKN